MEASPDALNPDIHDPSRRGSPAVRAAKDITFGSVRPKSFVCFSCFDLFCACRLGCRNSFEVFRTPLRPHQGSLASTGARCYCSIPWTGGLSGPNIQKGRGAGLISCMRGSFFLGVPSNAHFPNRVCPHLLWVRWPKMRPCSSHTESCRTSSGK